MKNILQRIAYVQGLADGLGLEDTSKEGQILLELVDVVSELAEVVDEKFEDLDDYVDVIEEDLGELEGYVYDDEAMDDYDDFDFDDFEFYDDEYPSELDAEYNESDSIGDEEE